MLSKYMFWMDRDHPIAEARNGNRIDIVFDNIHSFLVIFFSEMIDNVIIEYISYAVRFVPSVAMYWWIYKCTSVHCMWIQSIHIIHGFMNNSIYKNKTHTNDNDHFDFIFGSLIHTKINYFVYKYIFYWSHKKKQIWNKSCTFIVQALVIRVFSRMKAHHTDQIGLKKHLSL